ncbi:hypothetical protein [Sphingopyxis sp. KK2]|uniref:hypothetical protein n=1 Tax=Sphingopyxis sp. KK2 TaxID=1855727 RepID=UPI001181A38B|nr:hypothetical protein [Sphingopyxis sp. KK2]
MPVDPLDTPRHRLRSILRNWSAIAIAVLAVLLIAGWGYVSSTGTETIISGTIIRIEQDGAKSLKTRAHVRLLNGTETAVFLPGKTNCRTGSTVRLIQRDNAAGRTFHTALVACTS